MSDACPATFQLYVAAHPGAIAHLTQENCAAVAELRHEVAELMACIGHRDGHGTGRQRVAGKQSPQGMGIESCRAQVQISRKSMIELHQARFGHRRRSNSRKEAFRQAGVAAGIHAKAARPRQVTRQHSQKPHSASSACYQGTPNPRLNGSRRTPCRPCQDLPTQKSAAANASTRNIERWRCLLCS